VCQRIETSGAPFSIRPRLAVGSNGGSGPARRRYRLTTTPMLDVAPLAGGTPGRSVTR